MKSPLPLWSAAWIFASVSLVTIPSAAAATVAQNPIGSAADGQNIVLDIESAPGFRFTVDGTLHVESIEITLTQSTGAFAVVFLQTYNGTPFPGSWLVVPQHPMLMNPPDVVIFDPAVINGPTTVTIPYDTVLPPGEYILTFNILAPTSTHTFLAYDPVSDSEGVQWTPNWNTEHTSYGTVAWSDTTLQPDIRINGTLIPEPSSAALLSIATGTLLRRRKRSAV
jgi:hypothetical protein